jgi:hypothetical protein
MSTKENETSTLTAEELLDIVGHSQGLAALHGAAPDIVALALAGLPRGTRMTALEYGLIEPTDGDRFVLTELGQQVVVAAAARHPEPLADVALSDLIASTQSAVAVLTASSRLRVLEPRRTLFASDETPLEGVLARARRRLFAGVGRRLGQQRYEQTPRS